MIHIKICFEWFIALLVEPTSRRFSKFLLAMKRRRKVVKGKDLQELDSSIVTQKHRATTKNKEKRKERPLVFLHAQIFVGPRVHRRRWRLYGWAPSFCPSVHVFAREHVWSSIPRAAPSSSFSRLVYLEIGIAQKRVRPRLVDGKTKKSPPTSHVLHVDGDDAPAQPKTGNYLLPEAVAGIWICIPAVKGEEEEEEEERCTWNSQSPFAGMPDDLPVHQTLLVYSSECSWSGGSRRCR